MEVGGIPACSKNSVLHKEHRDLVTASLERDGHLGDKLVARFKWVSGFDQNLVGMILTCGGFPLFFLQSLKREFRTNGSSKVKVRCRRAGGLLKSDRIRGTLSKSARLFNDSTHDTPGYPTTNRVEQRKPRGTRSVAAAYS